MSAEYREAPGAGPYRPGPGKSLARLGQPVALVLRLALVARPDLRAHEDLLALGQFLDEPRADPQGHLLALLGAHSPLDREGHPRSLLAALGVGDGPHLAAAVI